MDSTTDSGRRVRPGYLLASAAVTLAMMVMLVLVLVLVGKVFDSEDFRESAWGLTVVVYLLIGSYIAVSGFVFLVLKGSLSKGWLWAVWLIVASVTIVSLATIAPCVYYIRSASAMTDRYVPVEVQQRMPDTGGDRDDVF